jgi:Protein containing von Willebrand factor type A (vWA) domain
MVEFFNILRASGMNISVSDCITAVEALQYVNLVDRTEVKAALCTCLVKSESERSVFSKAFELFFVPVETRQQYINEKAGILKERKQEILAVASKLQFQEESLDISDELKEIFAGIPEEEQKSLENFLDTTSTGRNVGPDFKQITEKMVRGRLKALKQKYSGQMADVAGALSVDLSETGIIADEVKKSALSANALLRRNIGDIRDEDIPAVIRLIAALVEKLKRELSRNYRKNGKRSRLDLKRTIRSNLATGQVMFRLKFKSRKRSRNKLLLLCDVSASMLRFSSFALQFIIGMQSSYSSFECYIFSEDMEKINIKAFFGLEDFESHVRGHRIWGKGTNIGKALGQVLHDRISPVGSSTVLVILSDAKTVDYKLCESKLSELSTRVKRIIWMNPLPEKDWRGIKGIDSLLGYCTMLDSSSLERLAAACSNL